MKKEERKYLLKEHKITGPVVIENEVLYKKEDIKKEVIRKRKIHKKNKFYIYRVPKIYNKYLVGIVKVVEEKSETIKVGQTEIATEGRLRLIAYAPSNTYLEMNELIPTERVE